MPKPPGGLLRRKRRLQTKFRKWFIGVRGWTNPPRTDLRNQRHRKEVEEDR